MYILKCTVRCGTKELNTCLVNVTEPHFVLMSVLYAEAGFQFSAQTVDWGFKNLATREQVYSSSEGFLVNDALRFSVSIQNYSDYTMAEAHLYTIIQLARETDFAAQIGNSQYFDLVDLDKVCLACLNPLALLLLFQFLLHQKPHAKMHTTTVYILS